MNISIYSSPILKSKIQFIKYVCLILVSAGIIVNGEIQIHHLDMLFWL